MQLIFLHNKSTESETVSRMVKCIIVVVVVVGRVLMRLLHMKQKKLVGIYKIKQQLHEFSFNEG